MAFDLSQTQARVPRQDRLVDRRSGIIQEVDPRQKQRQIFGEMRNARRGNSGEALMEALGMVNKTAGQLADVNQQVHDKREKERADRGALDAQTGKVDEELMKRSKGYRDAVSLGRASTEWTKHKQATDTEFEAFIEGQQDLDLPTRQAQAAAWIEQHYFHDFALDPNDPNKPRDFGSPTAFRALAETFGKSRAELMAHANARIEERFNGEAVTHFSDFVREQAKSGHGVDLNEAFKLVPPTVPQEVVTQTYLDTAMAASEELSREGKTVEAVAIIDQALGYGEAQGAVQPLAPTQASKPQTLQQKIGRITIASDKLASLVMHQESRGNPNAVSSEGAVGTMQTMPFTLRDPGFGVRPAKDDSPAERERVGKDYLKAMGKRYSGNITLQLAAYNAGPGVVDDWLHGTNRTGKNKSLLKLPDPRQKGISENDFWARIPFKETKDYVRNITAAGGQPVETGGEVDAIAQGNPDFVTPGRAPDVADRLRGFTTKLMPEMKGRFAMTPAQRTKLLQFRASQLTEGKRIDAEERQKKVDAVEDEFSMRLVGQGPALTVQDIMEKVSPSDGSDPVLNGEEGAKWIKTLEAQSEAAQAKADAAANRQDREDNKAREDQAQNIVNGYVVSVMKGEPPAKARARMLQDLPSIKDPLVRAAVISAAGSQLNGLESLRMDTPDARQFDTDMDGLELSAANSLQGRILRTKDGRPLTPDQAQGMVKIKLNQMRVEGVSSLRDHGKRPDWKTSKEQFSSWFNQTFPKKPVVKDVPQY